MGSGRIGDVDGPFAHDGYTIVRALVAHPARAFLHDYALTSARTGQLRTDGAQVPGTPFCYADPLMESLLEALGPRLEAETGLALGPTYSYFRVYRRGDVLHRHTDRPACEASVTVNLGGDKIWPIWLEVAGRPVAVALQPGDGLIYRGIQLAHWREAFEGEHAVQAFLHYVERDGANKEWIFDKRPGLGTSPAARQIIQRLLGSDR
jgi:hypothetical protein